MIEISNLTSSPVKEELMKEVARQVLRGEKKEKETLSIVFVGPRRMRKLNKKYRGKNRTTDVLAFGGLGRAIENQKLPASLKRELGLGEIVICLREVKKNAKRLSSKAELSSGTFEKELATCLIHGILHLLGYNHEKDRAAAEEMQKTQNYYLSKVELP